MTAGLHCLQVTVAQRSADAVRDRLLSHCSSGFEERDAGARVSFVLYVPDKAAVERLRKDLVAVLADHSVQFRAEHKAIDWQAAWIANLGPQALTEHTTVVPVKRRPKAAQAKGKPRKLYLLQQAAFGFGEHPTTRLMAEQLEQLLEACTDRKKLSVLDVGCGTGVLGILAALRGAQAVGIDIDQPSVDTANANAVLNGVSRRCQFANRPLQKINERFDVVLANVDAVTLQRLSKALRRVSKRGTALLLSGILTEDVSALAATFSKLGFTLRSQREQQDWVMLEYRL